MGGRENPVFRVLLLNNGVYRVGGLRLRFAGGAPLLMAGAGPDMSTPRRFEKLTKNVDISWKPCGKIL